MDGRARADITAMLTAYFWQDACHSTSKTPCEQVIKVKNMLSLKGKCLKQGFYIRNLV